MSIYISNSIYLNGGLGADFNGNNPIVGYDSILQPQDIQADEFTPGRPAINMWTPDTSSVWEGITVSGSPSVATTQYITLANSNNRPVDYVGIARHNFGDVGYTYTLQHSVDGGAVWDNISTPRIVGNNNAIIEYFDVKTSGLFRIELSKTLAGSPAVIAGPVIAHIKLGRALVLQRRIYVGHEPTIIDKVKTITNGSDSGQYLGKIIVRSYRSASISQDNNTPAFVREKVVPFLNHCNGQVVINNTSPTTFFFSWRPTAYPLEVAYCWAEDISYPENSGSDGLGGRMKWSVSCGAIA